MSTAVDLNLDPGTTTFVFMDFQDALLPRIERSEELLGRAASVLEAARAAGAGVVFVRVAFRPGYPEVNDRDAMYLLKGSSASSIAAADLNGDGQPDLAISNNFDNTVSVLVNKGNGAFAAAVQFPTGLYPESVAMADLDGDGRIDLAVANAHANTVSVLLNVCLP